MIEFIAADAWIFWLALLLVFVIIEVATVDFTFLMLAGGCSGGLIAAAFGAPFVLQVLISGALALVLLFVVRPAIKRSLDRGADHKPTNVAGLLGMAGTVTKAFVNGDGQVRLANGETWTARLPQPRPTSGASLGESVTVTAIDGATALVFPTEGSKL